MKRKSLIYKTGVEYGDYTLNHVEGCSHGCKYPCYAFMMKRRFGKVEGYSQWVKPCIVENAIELLDKELPKYRNKIKTLHLCFTTDPFMFHFPEIEKLSLEILRRANASNIRCSVLTKGILPTELADLPLNNEYGITLVSLSEDFRKEFEPGAAPIQDRIRALKALSDRGCYTWISIEPYPTPNIIEQDLLSILDAVKFADKIIFGRLHYNKIVSKYKDYQQFYNACARMVVQFCSENGIAYHIKDKTVKGELEI